MPSWEKRNRRRVICLNLQLTVGGDSTVEQTIILTRYERLVLQC